jgi:hypothetical protein
MPSALTRLASGLTSMFGGGRSATPSSDQPGPPADRPAPHVYTFGQVINQVWKTYSYRSDEALRHNTTNALVMRRDCYIRSLLQERYLPTARRKWVLEVDDAKDPYQAAVRDALTKVVKSTERFIQFRRYLLEAIWYGRYAAQGVWEKDPAVRDELGRPLWCFRRHQPVNGDKIQFQWDGTPAIAVNIGATTWPEESIILGDRFPLLRLDRPAWRRQFILHKHEVEDADFLEGEMAGRINGYGLRDVFYWAWWMRDELLSWALDFMQKVGTLGLLIFWYDESNKGAKKQAEENAKSASSRTALVMPRPAGRDGAAWGVDQIAPSTGGVEALQKMISDYFERHLERMAVGQSMSSGADRGDGLGGTGRADFARDTKYQILACDAANLDESLTLDLVGPAKALNFPDTDFPVRFKSLVPDPEVAEKIGTMTKVWEYMAVKADEAYELVGFTRPGPNDETVGGRQPAPAGPPLGGLLGDPESYAAVGGRSATLTDREGR